MSTTSNFQLDHIIILLPYRDIQSPPDWLRSLFTITPGGTHADGKTANVLVLIADGVYLEIIAFIEDDPSRRKGHWWDKPFGIVDFSLTSPPSSPFDYGALQARLAATASGVTYDVPQAGGRQNTDGQAIKWEVTFPVGVTRGEVPFFCNDVTPRERRVPISQDRVSHASGIIGVKSLEVWVPEGRLTALWNATAAILENQEEEVGFHVGVPIEGVENQPKIKLKALDAEQKTMHTRLVLRVQEGAALPPNVERHVGEGVVSINFEH